MPFIRCHQINKHFGTADTRVDALKGIDLEIEKGEIRLLMGPSGSGKTTLISIIAGILTPDSGECWVGDVCLSQLTNDHKTHFRGRHIGFVFQAFNLIPTLTIEENVAIPLLLIGTPPLQALSAAKDQLKLLDLQSKIGVYPAALSGGQQQRVAIARAVIHHPALIVCDEPTSYLDADNGVKIMKLLHDLVKTTQATLIIVTHDGRITSFADTINHLEDGCLRI